MMMRNHKKRMRAIGRVAIPPEGTCQRTLVEQYLKDNQTEEDIKAVNLLWSKSQAIVCGQQYNGAGHQTDQAIRWFHQEYNNRIWTHGLHSLPSTFNIAEAFYAYRPELNTFIINNEINHLFSFPDFVNWYTSDKVTLDFSKSIEFLEEGVVYTFHNLHDPAELLYDIEKGSEIGFTGFVLVRFGSEVSVLCIAGETENLEKKTKELKEHYDKYQPTQGRNGVKPDPDLNIEAVALESSLPLWRILALTRFDIEDMSQSVRYICHDNGIAYSIKTDDPTIFLDMKDDEYQGDVEILLRKSAEEVREYNSLFDLCSSALFIPMYMEEHSDNIVVERIKTKYSKYVTKPSFKNIKKDLPIKYRIATRNVFVLRGNEDNLSNVETIYSTENFHVQSSGYWRNLGPGKYGADKKGNPIHGKTWVAKKLSWMEAEEPTALVAKRGTIQFQEEGPAPGFIYVMRSPLHAPNVFKIGLTTRSTQERANELSSATGVAGRIYVLNQWAVGDCITIEKEIHKQLAEFRVDPRREFFEGSLEHFMIVINEIIQELNE